MRVFLLPQAFSWILGLLSLSGCAVECLDIPNRIGVSIWVCHEVGRVRDQDTPINEVIHAEDCPRTQAHGVEQHDP